MEEKKEIGVRIRQIRKVLGLSQEEFAENLNVANGTLSEVENGKIKPGFEILKHLYNDFNVDLEYIINGKGEMFRQEKPPLSNNPDLVLLDHGEYTDEIREILLLMKNSNFALVSIIGLIRRFLLKNKPQIINDVNLAKQKTSIIKEINKEIHQKNGNTESAIPTEWEEK